MTLLQLNGKLLALKLAISIGDGMFEWKQKRSLLNNSSAAVLHNDIRWMRLADRDSILFTCEKRSKTGICNAGF